MAGADTLIAGSWALMATGALTFGILRRVSAPYGRFMREGWGPTLPSRWGWMLMEAPSAVGFVAVYLRGSHRAETVPLALLLLWQAHYLGEILEWSGWALATWSWPGLAFAVFTFTNLAPRALATHRWYRRTFPDYPSDRRALVPFVL